MPGTPPDLSATIAVDQALEAGPAPGSAAASGGSHPFDSSADSPAVPPTEPSSSTLHGDVAQLRRDMHRVLLGLDRLSAAAADLAAQQQHTAEQTAEALTVARSAAHPAPHVHPPAGLRRASAVPGTAVRPTSGGPSFRGLYQTEEEAALRNVSFRRAVRRAPAIARSEAAEAAVPPSPCNSRPGSVSPPPPGAVSKVRRVSFQPETPPRSPNANEGRRAKPALVSFEGSDTGTGWADVATDIDAPLRDDEDRATWASTVDAPEEVEVPVTTGSLLQLRSMRRQPSRLVRNLAATDASASPPTTAQVGIVSPGKRTRAPRKSVDLCSISALRETSVAFAVLDAGQTLVATALCVLAVCGLFTEISDTDNTYDDPMRVTAIPATLCCNAFSAVWVLSRFFVFTRTGWDVLDTTATIRHQYVRTWLAYDLFCAVPVEWVFVGWAWPVFFGLLLRNVLRFPRILLLTHPTNPLSPPRNWLRFLFFMGVSAVLVAAAAAFFAHIEGLILSTGVYWSIITMTGVGYGDVSPSEDGNSRLVGIFTALIGVCAIATTTAFATSLLTTSDKLTEQLDHKKQMMHSMLQYYDIPWHIQREVIAMFPAVLDAQNEVEFKTIAESLPAFVARKIQGYARAKILHGVPLFAGLDSGGDALFDLAKRLRQSWAAQGELIIEAGEFGIEMYFLVRGVAEVMVPSAEDLDEDIVVATLRTGQYFGEIALIEDTVRTASIQAVTLCEMLVLSKEDFAQVTDTHPELRRLFEDEVFARRKRNAQVLQKRASVANSNLRVSIASNDAAMVESSYGTPSSVASKPSPSTSARDPISPSDRPPLALPQSAARVPSATTAPSDLATVDMSFMSNDERIRRKTAAPVAQASGLTSGDDAPRVSPRDDDSRGLRRIVSDLLTTEGATSEASSVPPHEHIAAPPHSAFGSDLSPRGGSQAFRSTGAPPNPLSPDRAGA